MFSIKDRMQLNDANDGFRNVRPGVNYAIRFDARWRRRLRRHRHRRRECARKCCVLKKIRRRKELIELQFGVD